MRRSAATLCAALILAVGCARSNDDPMPPGEDTASMDAASDAAGPEDDAVHPPQDVAVEPAADACVPDCEGLDCGWDGCGGSCGQCKVGGVCISGICCTPECDGKDCGPDGCGGWCGACDVGTLCVLGACAQDTDQDGIPDSADPMPDDPGFPGTVAADAVYAHTSDTLYKMNVKTYQLDKVGDFQWTEDGGNHLVTDIGVDRYGVLYAVTFTDVYACHPVTAGCLRMGGQSVDTSFNGMTLVPQGYLDPYEDTLVAISKDGGWFRLSLSGDQFFAHKLGEYGPPYSSAGDAYSIDGVGTFAAVHKEGAPEDFLVRVNPSNGKIMAEVGPIGDYTGIFGLAGWAAKAFAFDKEGDVILVDTNTGGITVLHETGLPWWGAGVRTVLNP